MATFCNNWIQFLKQVHRGQQIPKVTLASSLQGVLRRSFVWYNEEDFKRTAPANRFIHCLLISIVVVFWSLVIISMTRERVDMGNLVGFCKLLSLVLGGVVTVCRLQENWRHRALISHLISTINGKVLQARRTASEDQLRYSCKYYVTLVISISCAIGLGLCICLLILCDTLVTGRHYFKLALPVMITSTIRSWWLEVLWTQITMVFCVLCYTLMDGILIDCVLQLTFLYSFQYDQLRQLSRCDGHHFKPFIVICKELNELKTLTAGFLKVIRGYQFLFWTISYILLGMASFCLAMEVGKGWFATYSVLFYPIYVALNMAIWAFVGTYFDDTASQLNSILFNWDWTDMPPRSRKLIILLMMFGQHTPRIKVPPFYIINRQFFAEVLRKTYQFYAVIRNVYL